MSEYMKEQTSENESQDQRCTYLAEIIKAYDLNIISKNEARAMIGLEESQESTDSSEMLPEHISMIVYALAAKAKVDARKSPTLFDK